MATTTDNPDAPASSSAPKPFREDAQGSINAAASTSSRTGPLLNSSISNAEDLTTRLLRFLSAASGEVLVGIVLGLLISTYLVLGRIGLLLIGTLGGIVLHATWEGQSSPAGRVEDARRKVGLDVVKRVLDWREHRAESRGEEETDHVEEYTMERRGFEDFQPETRAALTGFVDAVIRDYVKWWYTPIVPTDESFPAACRHTFTAFLRSISTHLSRKRPADTFLDFLTNSSSIVIVFLNELSSALSASQTTGVSPAEAVDDYLLMNPESNLANILNKKQQKKKFKIIAEEILENFLEKPAFNCNPMRIFLKEMLASVVMEMSLKSFSRAEWINGWIVYLLEEGEPEFSQVIDAGMGSTSLNGVESNLGNTNSTKSNPTEEKTHRKRLSKAEEAMEEAMEEAKRLSQLIAEEESRKLCVQEPSGSSHLEVKSDEPADEARISQELHPFLPDMSENENVTQNAVNVNPNQPSLKAPTSGIGAAFTSFDQIVPPSQLTALQADAHTSQGSLTPTLHNANIVIMDDSTPNDKSDKGRIRTKPMGDYLIQIEPKFSSGWIVMRKFHDFETLHES